MDSDEFIDAFVATIILIVGVAVVAYLYSSRIGGLFIDLLPDIIQFLVAMFITVFVLLIARELIES